MFARSQCDRALDRLRVRVDQELRRVEAVALLGRPGAVDAVAVALPGPDPGQVAVPVERRPLGQLEARLARRRRRRGRARRARRSRRRARSSCPRRPSVAPSGNGFPGQTLMRGARPSRAAKSATQRRRGRAAARASAPLVEGDLELARQLAPQAEQVGVELAPALAAARASSARRSRSSCGSGTSPREAREAANSRRRPSRVASAMTGSMWSVKNWNGAARRTPRPGRASGVYGAKRTTAARDARASRPGGGRRAARLPTWSWFWAADDEPLGPSGRSSSARDARERAVELRVVAVAARR